MNINYVAEQQATCCGQQATCYAQHVACCPQQVARCSSAQLVAAQHVALV